MQTTGKAAVIGDNDSVLVFKALGLEVYIVEDAMFARDAIRRLNSSGCVVIFITEKLMAAINDNKLKKQTHPIIIPIPDGNGSTGYGSQLLKNNIKKAVGTEINFKEKA